MTKISLTTTTTFSFQRNANREKWNAERIYRNTVSSYPNGVSIRHWKTISFWNFISALRKKEID